MDNNIDKETQAVISEGLRVTEFVASEGWRYVKQKFTEKIMDLQSIRNLDKTKSAMLMQREIVVRELVVDTLMDIIKEIEGRASQHQGNVPLTEPETIGYQ